MHARCCNLSKRGLPQPQGSFRCVLLVSLPSSWAPSPASSARSTGLQLGTDAGMSSVLLTMVGSQCGNRNPPPQLSLNTWVWGENTKICFSPAISRLGGYMRRVQAYKNKSTEEGQCCTWCWWSHVVSSSPWPICLCDFPTHRAWRYGKPQETNRFYKLIWFLWEMLIVSLAIEHKKSTMAE